MKQARLLLLTDALLHAFNGNLNGLTMPACYGIHVLNNLISSRQHKKTWKYHEACNQLHLWSGYAAHTAAIYSYKL